MEKHVLHPRDLAVSVTAQRAFPMRSAMTWQCLGNQSEIRLLDFADVKWLRKLLKVWCAWKELKLSWRRCRDATAREASKPHKWLDVIDAATVTTIFAEAACIENGSKHRQKDAKRKLCGLPTLESLEADNLTVADFTLRGNRVVSNWAAQSVYNNNLLVFWDHGWSWFLLPFYRFC